MDEPVFADKSQKPSDADLARALGAAKRRWDDFTAHAAAAAPAASPEWKFYSGKSGWVFLLRGKKRNVVYLRPLEKCFLVSFAFGEKAVQAAELSELPAEIIESVRQAPKYPEGRAVRLDVKSAAQVKVAKKLLAIKLEN